MKSLMDSCNGVVAVCCSFCKNLLVHKRPVTVSTFEVLN